MAHTRRGSRLGTSWLMLKLSLFAVRVDMLPQDPFMVNFQWLEKFPLIHNL